MRRTEQALTWWNHIVVFVDVCVEKTQIGSPIRGSVASGQALVVGADLIVRPNERRENYRNNLGGDNNCPTAR